MKSEATMNTELQILKSNPLFRGLEDKDIYFALSAFSATQQSYEKGEILVSAGGRMNRFGLVLSGIVSASFSDIDGNDILMANVGAGETFGESLCWLKIEEIPVSVAAVTDSVILWLDPHSVPDNNQNNIAFELSIRFASMLAQKTLSMNDRIQVLSKPTIRQKLLTLFAQWSVKSGSKLFSVPYDRETLARYLGVNRSALSRELSLMQKEGIIEFYKNTFKILK